jgi:hypothetical protein
MRAPRYSSKEEREMVDTARALGFAAERTGGGHWRFTHPALPTPYFGPSTPRLPRSFTNAITRMKRAIAGKPTSGSGKEHRA